MLLPIGRKEISAGNGESRERGRGGEKEGRVTGMGKGRGKTCNDAESKLCLKEHESLYPLE